MGGVFSHPDRECYNMIRGTYEIKNKLDGMAYGGSSGNIKQRWKKHRWMLRNNKHHCIRLQRAWNKYGKKSFKFRILEVIEDADERLAAEQIWLDIHHADKTCYNSAITAGTAGPVAEETKQKIRASMMGNENSLGHTWSPSDEQCREISERLMGNQNARGYKFTEEECRARSERMMGNQYGLGCKRTDEQNRANSERLMGKKHTEERKQAKSERMMGHEVSDRTKAKIGTAFAQPYPAFIHRDTGEIIPAGINLRRMCRGRGLSASNICRVKNGKRSHHKEWTLLVEKKDG